MLKHLFLLLVSTLSLLSSPQHCTLDLAKNTVEVLCEDASLDLLIEHAKGKLTKITDASGSLSFAYDAKGNIVTKTQVIDDKTFATGYTYNAQDKLTSQTLPSGKVIGYEYSQTGELSSISIDGAPFITDITTNQNGLISYTYADGTTHSREYDTNGRVTKLIYPNYTEEVTYNAVNNITQIKADATSRSFDYDLVDRIVKYDNNATDYQRFSYDANGNRLSLNQEINKTISLNYQDASNILTTIKQIKRVDENTTQVEQELNLTYDKNGNIINDTTHTYSYDNKNRLVAIDDNITYSYNYKNQRVSKTTPQGTTYFVYDEYKLIGEYNQDGTPINEYIYLNDTPIAIITPDNTYYIYADHIDTPRAVADTDNNIIWKWESKPFGETVANEDPDQDGNSFTLNLRFPGQYADSESGLYYNFNRYYSPTLGRYITSDPIGFEGGSNTYLYANANSLRFSDPEGNLGLDTVIKAGVIVWKGVVWLGKKAWKSVKGIFVKTKIPENSIEHIFSKKHIKDGILKLGRNKEDIINKIEKTVDKYSNLLGEGSNEIHTIMNGYEATIRIYVKNGKILSVDAFKGISPRTIGKLIKDY